MDGAPSTIDMYLALCAWTDPHTLFMDDTFINDQYRQSSGLSYSYVPNHTIAWPSIPGVEHSYFMASQAQGEAFSEIGAPSQTLSRPLSCATQQISSLISENSKKPRPTITKDDKRKICQYHEANRELKHLEVAKKFGYERSTISKILKQKPKYLNPFISEQDLGPDFADTSKSDGAMETCENSSFILGSEADSMSTMMESPLNFQTKKKGESCGEKRADESELLDALECIERFFESTCDGLSFQERGAILYVREEIIRS